MAFFRTRLARFVPCCFDLSLVASNCPLLPRFVPCWLGFVCDFPHGFLTCGPTRASEWARVLCSLSAFLVPFLLLVRRSKLPLPYAMHETRGCEGRLARGWRGGRGSVRAGGVPGWLSDVWALCLLSTFLVPFLLLVRRSKLPLPYAMHGTRGCEGRLARGWGGGRGSVWAGCPVG